MFDVSTGIAPADGEPAAPQSRALLCTSLVLISVRICLVQTDDADIPVRLGSATAIVRRGRQFEETIAFSTFIVAGLFARRNLAKQKRWMTLPAA